MQRLVIGVLDLVAGSPRNSLYGKVMNANLASIMPQVVAVWCEAAGHEARYVCYTGPEDLHREFPSEMNLLFISAFTETAQLAYAVSNYFRQHGVITALGGPHARCYPQDACKYFDYVFGFTDRALVEDVLRDCAPHRPIGLPVTAGRHPRELPGMRERWKFAQQTLAKAPTILRSVPMIASLGCPYSCDFCIDSQVPYQPLDPAQLREDLRFLASVLKLPIVGWHDPNFGVRFDECLGVLESAAPGRRFVHIGECSLSILTEPNLKRLRDAGFVAVLPGIESWYGMGNKSRAGHRTGKEKLLHVAEQVNQVLRYIPYVQTNFVLGLDDDEGGEPFELTKRFVDLCPAAFPGYSLFTAFGEAAPLNFELQRAGRVLPFPFRFLNNNQAMNVRPKNYSWTEFYDHVIDLTSYTFSPRSIARRALATRELIPRMMNTLRAISAEGSGRTRYHRLIRRLLERDTSMWAFFEGETDQVPAFYIDRLRREMGNWWAFLPPGALSYDPGGYFASHQGLAVTPGG